MVYVGFSIVYRVVIGMDLKELREEYYNERSEMTSNLKAWMAICITAFCLTGSRTGPSSSTVLPPSVLVTTGHSRN